MIRKIARDILILLGLFALWASTSRDFMAYVSEKRIEREEWWGVHHAVEGDLVSMSYLDKVSKFISLRDYSFTKHPVDTGASDLYIWGDSHIWKIPDSAYAAINKYKFAWRFRDDLLYTLDSNRKNILVIEITERYLRTYFSNTDMYNHVHKEQSSAALPIYTEPAINYAGFDIQLVEDLFNHNINQNLEFNLFNYNFINPVRQWKASMNYYIFSRASGDVVISKNGNQLFLKETVRGNRPENAYQPVSDEEVNNIVNTINEIEAHYKQEGFDEVYLTIIPNPVSILQPEGTNMLVPRIENHPQLRIKRMSIYNIYKKENRTIYRPGDSHWNNEGLQIWLGEINKMLLSENTHH